MMNNKYSEIIAKKYLKQFYAFALSRTHNADEAEELSQEITYQALYALSKAKECSIENLPKYIWSVAHNTYKRWLYSAKRSPVTLDETMFYGYIAEDADVEKSFIEEETKNSLYREISMLANMYREVIVAHYYDGLNSIQTAKKLGITAEMARFYLMKSKQKIREGIEMQRKFGEKSFNPSSFNPYYSGIDYASINIWDVFKKKLAQNIVLAAYENSVSVEELSLETGVPAVYLEEELDYLANTGLLKETSRGKYQTAFFILKKSLHEQIFTRVTEYTSECADKAIQIIERALPRIKILDIFEAEASDLRYRYLFLQKQNIFCVPDDCMNETEYPVILADGSRGFIWGEECGGLDWSVGGSSVDNESYFLQMVDFKKLGHRHQNFFDKFRYPERCEAMYEIASGKLNEEHKAVYAELIEKGYAVRADSTVKSNIPVFTREIEKAYETITTETARELNIKPDFNELLKYIERIVKSNFNKLIKGSPQTYAYLVLTVNFNALFISELYRKCYINIPEASDITPMTSYIVLK